MTVIVNPDELDAMIESGGVAWSMSANSLILKSGRSGPFSWTKSACSSASFIAEVKANRSRLAPGERPISVRAGHASSTYLRRFSSALGAGSVAITSIPRARYCAVQLAPITPVPTIAMRRTGLLKDIVVFSLRLIYGASSSPTLQGRGVLDSVGAVLHVFQNVISGRDPIYDSSGLLAGETLIDRQAHSTSATLRVHLHQ